MHVEEITSTRTRKFVLEDNAKVLHPPSPLTTFDNFLTLFFKNLTQKSQKTQKILNLLRKEINQNSRWSGMNCVPQPPYCFNRPIVQASLDAAPLEPLCIILQ